MFLDDYLTTALIMTKHETFLKTHHYTYIYNIIFFYMKKQAIPRYYLKMI
ncbi:hypothetical protein LPICM02_270028 [Pseudolactococcus piscium]|nr:hypothetical protein LPICM02_270028 [Lactococcus piscium]